MKAIFYSLIFMVPAAGCTLCDPQQPAVVPAGDYHVPGFVPSSLTRVLVLPLANESTYPRVAEEVQTVLAAEMQSVGCFEVIVAPCHPDLYQAQHVRANGQFNEQIMVDLARTFHADGILLGSVTQYHPYAPPRLGLSLQLIVPAQAVVAASIDALWDSRDPKVGTQASAGFRDFLHPFQTTPEGDLALTSPTLFQRYVAREAAQALLRPVPVPVPVPSEAPAAAARPREPLPSPSDKSVGDLP